MQSSNGHNTAITAIAMPNGTIKIWAQGADAHEWIIGALSCYGDLTYSRKGFYLLCAGKEQTAAMERMRGLSR